MIPLARKGKLVSNRDNRINSMIMIRGTEEVSSALVQRIPLACLCTEGRQNVLLHCKQYDKTGSSVAGSSSFKLDPIRVHNGSLVICLDRDL